MSRLTKTRLNRAYRRAATAALAAASAAVALSPAAHAFEHVTLRSGFAIDCVRHEPLDATHVRLYMHGDNNYQDLRATDIADIETLPDPPAPVVIEALPIVPPTLPQTTLTAADMHALLASAGAAHNIDEDLLASVVRTESAGHATAISRAGARGLMQLMPGTARDLGVQDPNRPDQNIAGGTAYLDALLTRYKDNLVLALAAYNAGPGAVDKYHGVPPFRETRAYVARVIRDFNRRKQASLSALAAATPIR